MLFLASLSLGQWAVGNLDLSRSDPTTPPALRYQVQARTWSEPRNTSTEASMRECLEFECLIQDYNTLLRRRTPRPYPASLGER